MTDQEHADAVFAALDQLKTTHEDAVFHGLTVKFRTKTGSEMHLPEGVEVYLTQRTDFKPNWDD